MFETKKTLALDALILNIRSKVDSGCKISGDIDSGSGLLVEGTILGDVVVRGGPLVVMPGGVLLGDILCHGDLYVCGQLGDPDAKSRHKVTILGTTLLAHTSVLASDLYHHGLEVYVGARLLSEPRDLRQNSVNSV